MAEGAVTINDQGRSNEDDFRRILDSRSDEVRDLAMATRNLVYDVYPETIEVVWLRQGSAGWGVGPKKFTEQFAYFMPYARYVTMGFYRGGDLPDPDGLLPESGGRQVSGELSMRSFKITDADQLRLPALRTLIEAAVEERFHH